MDVEGNRGLQDEDSGHHLPGGGEVGHHLVTHLEVRPGGKRCEENTSLVRTPAHPCVHGPWDGRQFRWQEARER